jgi:D-hydroxyproline dehydrogenase subunit beta
MEPVTPAVPRLTDHADVAIAGAGIVGLAHAYDALRRGLSVVVVERDERARGASVRNFGHGCVTAQAGDGLAYGLVARERWLALAEEAGFWARPTGTVMVARADDELAVMAEFAAARGPEQAALLSPDEVRERVPAAGVIGGLWMPGDLRVDARTAIPALAAWLAEQGVRFFYNTATTGFAPGALHTARGTIAADAVVLALGHDTDRLLPTTAEAIGLRRCALQMLRVAAPGGARIDPAVFTGLSILRYGGFADMPSLAPLEARFRAERPDLLDAQINLMLTQRPDGDLIVGDSHHYARTPSPFRDEAVDDLILAETAALLGVDRLAVKERWGGIYAHAPGREFLIDAPAAGVRAVAVTSGIGMTTALGLAPSVLDELLTETTPAATATS